MVLVRQHLPKSLYLIMQSVRILYMPLADAGDIFDSFAMKPILVVKLNESGNL